jgi:hypothetical protein
MGEVATRDFLRGELNRLVEQLGEQVDGAKPTVRVRSDGGQPAEPQVRPPKGARRAERRERERTRNE